MATETAGFDVTLSFTHGGELFIHCSERIKGEIRAAVATGRCMTLSVSSADSEEADVQVNAALVQYAVYKQVQFMGKTNFHVHKRRD